MKILKTLTLIVFFASLISGCVSVDPVIQKFESNETKMIRQHIAKGEALEKENLLSSALEQYKLALTIDPENESALQHRENVLARLWEKAQSHYKKGLQFDEQGKYDAARKEYLSALQNWPDYKEAKERLTSGGVVDEDKDYILHTLLYGESVSKLGMIYYGDFKKHSVIGKFNVLKDVTKVRVGETLKIPVIEGFPLSVLKQKQEAYLNAIEKTETDGAYAPEKKIQTASKKASLEPDTLPSPEDEITAPSRKTMPVSEAAVKEALPSPEKTVQKTLPSPEKTVLEPLPPLEEMARMTPSPSPEMKPSKDYEQGIELFNKKKYPESISLFLAAAENDPDNETLLEYLFKSHFQQGLVLFNSEDYLTARDSFRSALKYDKTCEKCPDYIEKCEATYKEKHYNLGIHYFGKEQLNKAIEEWTRVKNLDPEYKEVTPNLKKAEMLFNRLESIKKSTAE